MVTMMQVPFVDAPWLTAVWDGLYLDLLARLLLAVVLGGAIGLERETSGKPAGLRTNILICVGAALLTELSITIPGLSSAGGPPTDPTRITAQIVTGIGFLGAGTIIQSKGTVTGLTSAATLWVVAAIGIAAGAGAYFAAIGGAALVLTVLLPLGQIEFQLARVRMERTILIELQETEGVIERIQSLLELAGLRGQIEGLEQGPEEGHLRIRMQIRGKEGLFKKAGVHLLSLPEVHSISLQK